MSADPQSLELKRTIMNKCEYNATIHLKLTYFGIFAKSLVQIVTFSQGQPYFCNWFGQTCPRTFSKWSSDGRLVLKSARRTPKNLLFLMRSLSVPCQQQTLTCSVGIDRILLAQLIITVDTLRLPSPKYSSRYSHSTNKSRILPSWDTRETCI